MKIAINGAGIAGTALAWWLKKYGYEPVLFERSPVPRTGGYMIDFWGVGYDIAEKMNLLPELQMRGYQMNALHIVDKNNKTKARWSEKVLRSVTGNRFLSIARSELAAVILEACKDIEIQYGTHIVAMEQHNNDINAHLSNNTSMNFDLVIGADGLHSHTRTLAFGSQQQYEHSLGACVAAFTLTDYQPRNDLAVLNYRKPKRQVMRISLRDNKTLFLFTFDSSLVTKELTDSSEQKDMLRSIYKDMEWETPQILARMDEASDFYFDRVSQIKLDKWTDNRVALVGDAAACVSLLAGEGTGLAITEAYVLAGELHRANGNHIQAFKNYEQRLQPFLKEKQKAALQSLPFFVPKSRMQMRFVNLIMRITAVPFLAKAILGKLLHDNISLPEYEASPDTNNPSKVKAGMKVPG
jgi:2-polyprenyl-6-methoxyphenol hydroxylase-like FAD-dependent oxidoreductase